MFSISLQYVSVAISLLKTDKKVEPVSGKKTNEDENIGLAKDVGILTGVYNTLTNDVHEIKGKLDGIKETLDRIDGGIRATTNILMVLGSSGIFGAILSVILSHSRGSKSQRDINLLIERLSQQREDTQQNIELLITKFGQKMDNLDSQVADLNKQITRLLNSDSGYQSILSGRVGGDD
jgi:hypothetical protein